MKNTFCLPGKPVISIILFSILLAACNGEGGGTQSQHGYTNPAFPDSETPPVNSYYEISPERVVDPSDADPVTLTFKFETEVDRAEFWLVGNQRISLDQIGKYTWTQDLTHSQIFQNYNAGDTLVFVGYCETFVGSSLYQRLNLFLPVRSDFMPDVDYTILSSDMQISDHVLNLRHDELLLGGSTISFVWSAIEDSVQEAIGTYDYYALVGQVNAIANRTGGSLLCFPNTTFFDLANKGAVHEMGHCLGLAYSNHPLIANYGHWRLGNAAHGIMGWADPLAGSQGLNFPYWMETNNVAGTTRLWLTGEATEFNDLELYKMGLITEDEVEPILQFSDQEAAVAWMINHYSLESCGYNCQVIDIPSEYITIDDIIALDGPTLPAANTNITVGTIVLSHGELLNSNEMAFYDYMTARGEGTEPVQVMEGFSVYEGKPFYTATRGLMTLSTRVR